MIERDHPKLAIVKQCALLSISRSGYYHEPKGEKPENLELMAEIDRQFLETPFYGVVQMAWHLRAKGWTVNVKRVRRLMRLMGVDAHLPAAPHQRSGQGAQDLSVSFKWHED